MHKFFDIAFARRGSLSRFSPMKMRLLTKLKNVLYRQMYVRQGANDVLIHSYV